jgi:hypothetical protein
MGFGLGLNLPTSGIWTGINCLDMLRSSGTGEFLLGDPDSSGHHIFPAECNTLLGKGWLPVAFDLVGNPESSCEGQGFV